MPAKLSNVSNLLNVKTAALLATTSKKFKNEYERRLKGINERRKAMTIQAAQAGKLRKKEAIERLFNELVLRHGNIPSQVNYNVNQMIKVYQYLNGDRLNIIELLKIRRDQQALMRKLRKARERFNKKIQQEINNMVRSQGSTPNYNTSGWN
jgi:F0F1-type ATP synthase membrane subunit b/b'